MLHISFSYPATIVWYHLVDSVSVGLSVMHLSIFLFLDDNYRKSQWIYAKLGVCIHILETWGLFHKKYHTIHRMLFVRGIQMYFSKKCIVIKMPHLPHMWVWLHKRFVHRWHELYRCWVLVPAAITGVKNHGLSGYSESPSNHPDIHMFAGKV